MAGKTTLPGDEALNKACTEPHYARGFSKGKTCKILSRSLESRGSGSRILYLCSGDSALGTLNREVFSLCFVPQLFLFKLCFSPCFLLKPSGYFPGVL